MSGSPAARRSSRARRARVSGRMKRTTTTTKHGVRSPWGQRCTTNSENTPLAQRGQRAHATTGGPRARGCNAPPTHPRRLPSASSARRRCTHACFRAGRRCRAKPARCRTPPSPAPRRVREGAPPTRDAFPSKAATASATARRQAQGRGRAGQAAPPAAMGAERRSTPPRPPTKITTAICASRRNPNAPAGGLRGSARRRGLGGRCHHRRGAVRAEPARQRHAERSERRSARRQDARRRPVRQRHQAPTGATCWPWTAACWRQARGSRSTPR